VRHNVDAVRLQALHGLSLAAHYVGCEARRRTCSEGETGTEEIKWDYHIIGTTAK
jgi:hypothetical protein